MQEGPKHLKRGLKDLSPLFQAGSQKKNVIPISVPSGKLQSLSVFCPESPRLSLFLNGCLASKMQSLAYHCALISVGKKTEGATPVKRFCLSLSQFQEICHSKTRAAQNFESSVFFFDFDYTHPILWKKVMPILDKWILLIKPDQESMTEGYKFMKASQGLSPHMEYFMMVNGTPGGSGEALFEGFSEIVSRRLGLALHWMGYFDLRFPSMMENISIESLQRTSSTDSLEKRAFAGLIYPPSREEAS